MSDSKGRHRILVADDDPGVRAFLKAVFAEAGHEVEVCADGKSALKLLSRPGFSLLVTDMEMPGKSGLDVIMELRARDEDIFAVLISGNLTEEVFEACKRMDRVECLAKPFALADLHAAVLKVPRSPVDAR